MLHLVSVLLGLLAASMPVAAAPSPSAPKESAPVSGARAPAEAVVAELPAGGTPGPGQISSVASARETVTVAEDLFQNGDQGGALQVAEQVVAADPFNVEAHHLIQRIYRSRGDSVGLISRYRELAERYPARAASQYLLGNALLSADGRAAARPYFDRALQIDPRFGWAASISAILAQYDGNTAEALRLAQVSVEEITQDLLTASIYADLLRMNGRKSEGLRFMEQAAAANPGEPEYLIELWKLWARGVDDVEVARAEFAGHLAANQGRFFDTAEHTALLADFYAGFAMADTDTARQLWMRVADGFPGIPAAEDALMKAARLTPDPRDRAEIYNRVLDEYPDSPVHYRVYYTLLLDMIDAEQYADVRLLARKLISKPDPAPGDVAGRGGRPTEWGYTLQGIGYAGWFAAAQADGDAGNGIRYNVRLIGEREQPISPDALTAARALEGSDCNDPKSLQYVARYLLNSSYYRDLGIRLLERAIRAAGGEFAEVREAYGDDNLSAARKDLAYDSARMPIYYALAGMFPEAEATIEELLRNLVDEDNPFRLADAHYTAGYVFARSGRPRDAAGHFLISQWYSPSRTGDPETEIAGLYPEFADNEIERFEPGAGPLVALAGAGIRPIVDEVMTGGALGGDLLLMVFWATWSPTSVAQVEKLDELAVDMSDEGLSALPVGLQRRTTATASGAGPDNFARFLRDYPILTVPMARAERDTIDRLEIMGLPTTLLVDTTGRVVARQLSFDIEAEDWLERWREIVEEELERRAESR